MISGKNHGAKIEIVYLLFMLVSLIVYWGISKNFVVGCC